MKILSLFDWMACWYEALLRAWIKIDKYYASEIDKYAIQIALKNHPDIIEIWDVCNVKWEDYQDVDLLIWGSPCQWFSVAGKMLNFDDPRSKLFFEYVRILREIKPKYFLLENVKMKKEWQDIISRELWVEPIEINSSLVSAQNRRRLYRTNIPNISQPKDKGIILKDILQDNVDEKYYYSAERWNRILAWKYDIAKRLEDAQKKCNTLTTVWWGNHEKKILELISVEGGVVKVKQATKQWYTVANDGDGISLAYPNSKTRRGRVIHWKSNTLTTEWESHVILIPQNVRVRKYDVDIEWLKSELREHKSLSNKEIAERLDIPKTTVDHWFRIDNCFAIPDAEIRFRLKELLWITTDRFDKSITEFEEKPWTYEKAERKVLPSWKMTTLTTSQNDDIIVGNQFNNRIFTDKSWTIGTWAGRTNKQGMGLYYKEVKPEFFIRKLTPIEYERLQTLPDNYTEWVSDTQRYKMLWNWWTCDVVAHIFSFIK